MKNFSEKSSHSVAKPSLRIKEILLPKCWNPPQGTGLKTSITMPNWRSDIPIKSKHTVWWGNTHCPQGQYHYQHLGGKGKRIQVQGHPESPFLKKEQQTDKGSQLILMGYKTEFDIQNFKHLQGTRQFCLLG